MAESSAGRPPRSKEDRALQWVNRKPSGVKGALLRVGVALGLVGGGAAIETTLHPIESIADTTRDAIVQHAEDLQQAGQDIVSFYNKDVEIRDYNEQVASRLAGRTPLLDGEQIFEKVKVIPAGVNLEERQEMIDEGTPVNVRDFPSTYTPTGKLTDVLGTFQQGAEISHVIRVTGTAPNSREEGDWYAFLYKPPGEGENEPFKIGYIYGDYIQPEPVDTTSSNASTTSP